MNISFDGLEDLEDLEDLKNLKDLKDLKNLKNFDKIKDKIKNSSKTDNISFYTENDEKFTKYSSKEIEKIHLDLKGTRLEILENNSETKIYSMFCEKTTIENSVVGGCLYIKTISYKPLSKDVLILEIPSGIDFHGTVEDGNVRIEDLKFDNFSLKLDKGNLELTDVNTESIKLEVNAGNVEITDFKSENVKIEVNAGSVEIRDFSCEEFVLETNAGNVEFEDVNIVNAKIETNAGNVEFNDFSCEELKMEVNTGNVEGNIITVKKMYAQASMGNIDLEIEKDGLTYNYSNTMGAVRASSKFIRDKNDPDIFLDVSMGNIDLS